jgi:hypothetical protein
VLAAPQYLGLAAGAFGQFIRSVVRTQLDGSLSG